MAPFLSVLCSVFCELSAHCMLILVLIWPTGDSLYGLILHQSFRYFRTFTTDPLYIRLMVWLLCHALWNARAHSLYAGYLSVVRTVLLNLQGSRNKRKVQTAGNNPCCNYGVSLVSRKGLRFTHYNLIIRQLFPPSIFLLQTLKLICWRMVVAFAFIISRQCSRMFRSINVGDPVAHTGRYSW